MFDMPAIDTSGRHPDIQDIAAYFDYEHLPAFLQGFSQQCYDLAANMIHDLPDGRQLELGLLQLLQAKDSFVRAALSKQRDAAIALSSDLQEIRKAAIRDLDARLQRVTPENPMGVELPDGQLEETHFGRRPGEL